ncbi:hypothetical protein [Methylomagnum ishizawai]|uniref:hypothetical protein n=1 Tax=Methylomagnum ishizawai TaxID=1760988 RepID=UPI001C338ACC|nr:hypothetical protein [Methylomagnum ishizawai]BBL74898.1 hypothetical protein MishRS11D_19960 [Methylomagnum ishizawai]
MSDDPNENETGGPAAPTPSPPPSGAVLVNSQIVDAVRQTRNAVRIDQGDTSKVVDPGISYQKASQAAAFAVQDATDYLRNIMTISATAQGMALKLYLETKLSDPYLDVIAQAQKMVANAAANLEAVGKSAITVAKEFPR